MLIHWILCRMELNPGAAFYGNELKVKYSGEFTEYLRIGLLRKVRQNPVSSYYSDDRFNKLLLVVDGEKGLEAIDEDDPTFPPIPVTPEQLDQYYLDIHRYSEIVKSENNLAGNPKALSHRLYFLGQSTEDELIFPYVLALLDGTTEAIASLYSLPSLLPTQFARIRVICPGQTPDVEESRRLENVKIDVGLLRPDFPFVLPEFHFTEANMVTYGGKVRFETGSRSLPWRGKVFPLTNLQSAVVEMLIRAHNAGNPFLSWEQICKRLTVFGHYPQRMSDVFDNSMMGKTDKPILKVGKDVYRFNP